MFENVIGFLEFGVNYANYEMRKFMDEDFLLGSDVARRLYHEHAQRMPIIDYHSHIRPQMVAEDHHFKDMTELWIEGDIYKRRALRSNGIDEKYSYGTETTDREKFMKWAETVPLTIGTPLHHLTHLELRTAFGIDELLNATTAEDIYARCNDMLRKPEFSARGLLRRYNVEVLYTIDDPTSDLRWHQMLAQDPKATVQMLPTWRPDRAMDIERADFPQYMMLMGETAGVSITRFADLMDALKLRHEFFEQNGCRMSDHDIEEFYDEPYTDSQIAVIFEKAMRGQRLSTLETHQYKHCFLDRMAEMDYDAGWAQQFHCGAIRDSRNAPAQKLGADLSFDSIGEFNTALAMTHFLNALNVRHKLARTIIYAINPNSNGVFATMLGNFQDGSMAGKIQFGLGWWLHNQLDAIYRHIRAISVDCTLSHFIGFMTDAHSLLSYPRHEYFRRVLCNMLGDEVEEGLIPEDDELLGELVENISYNNVKQFLVR